MDENAVQLQTLPSNPRHSSASTGSTHTSSTNATIRAEHVSNRPTRPSSPQSNSSRANEDQVSFVSRNWEQLRRSKAPATLIKYLVGLITLVVTVYFGWQSLAVANASKRLEEQQTCFSAEAAGHPLSLRCREIIRKPPLLALVRRDITDKDLKIEATWSALKTVATFGLGVFTSIFFRPRVEPFRPVISPARQALSPLDGIKNQLQECERCARRMNTAEICTQTLEDTSEDDQFHACMRSTLLSNKIIPLSEDFKRLVSVKFMYLIAEKLRQLETHANPKLDESLKKVRAVCVGKIDDSAEVYRQQKSLARTLLDVLSSEKEPAAYIAGVEPQSWAYKHVWDLLGPLASLSSLADDASPDCSSDEEPTPGSTGERVHTIKERYEASTEEMSRKSKPDYDLVNVTKTPGQPPPAHPSTPPRSRPRSRRHSHLRPSSSQSSTRQSPEETPPSSDYITSLQEAL
ncbi:MAG: hypothetical protein Q9159_001231 [Coniocarpon cinnabarinum]